MKRRKVSGAERGVAIKTTFFAKTGKKKGSIGFPRQKKKKKSSKRRKKQTSERAAGKQSNKKGKKKRLKKLVRN